MSETLTFEIASAVFAVSGAAVALKGARDSKRAPSAKTAPGEAARLCRNLAVVFALSGALYTGLAAPVFGLGAGAAKVAALAPALAAFVAALSGVALDRRRVKAPALAAAIPASAAVLLSAVAGGLAPFTGLSPFALTAQSAALFAVAVSVMAERPAFNGPLGVSARARA